MTDATNPLPPAAAAVTTATNPLSPAAAAHARPTWLRPPSTPPSDLRSLFRAMAQGQLLGSPSRGAPDQLIADHYDRKPARPVTGSPLPVTSAIDGIERSRVLTYRTVGGGGGRPVILACQSAAALDTVVLPGAYLLAEDLHIICSWLDAEWAQALPAGLPVTVLDEHDADAVAAAAWDVIHQRRAQLERYVVAHAPVRTGGYLLLDGSLIDAPPRTDLVSVVKSVAGRWTTDTAYTNLPVGWRSPGLLLRSLTRKQTPRALRLRSAPVAISSAAAVCTASA